MPLFDIPKPNKNDSKGVMERVKKSVLTPPPVLIKSSGDSKKGDIVSRINSITTMVLKYLSKYEDKYTVIRDEETLHNYIDDCIKNGVISIDTETSGLDPLSDNIAGISIYTPGNKAAYIPVEHRSYITMMPVTNQISKTFIKAELERIRDANIKVIMFNAKFDIRVLKNMIGVRLHCYWDGFVASFLMNENEPHGLKKLHLKYCLNEDSEAFSFDELFEDFNFQYIPIRVGYLYAARDAEITYELYKFQEPYLTLGTEENALYELERVSDVFWRIEMPLIDALGDMEDTGTAFDFELDRQLSEKYNQILKEKENNFHTVCSNYETEINSYRRVMGSACKLESPINIGSAAQISILLYDILKLTSSNKNKPRGTGEDILQNIDHPISKAILEYREISKLLSTFIDKLPNTVNPNDGRIHAGFNAQGAATGRFSSQNPNLQQIPSHGQGKEVRKLFVASPGYIMMGSDFSAQEVRLCAHLSNDERMIEAYQQGKDLYCVIASIAFDVSYEECLEHNTDGTTNEEGKKRRSTAKAITLGVLYGKGIAAIAEDLHTSKQKASKIYNTIMQEFPGLAGFVEESRTSAIENGYVETIWGRKRRLPNMQLSKYEFEYVGSKDKNFDPLADEDDESEPGLDEDLINYYTAKMDKSWGFAQKNAVKEDALKDGLKIKDNGGFIAEAERQCVNSRVQGSAADQCKQAINLIYNDPKMKSYGFRLLLPVHDELIGEAPYEFAKEAGIRLSELMVETAKDLKVPFKCDVAYFERWYGDEYDETNVDELIDILKQKTQ